MSPPQTDEGPVVHTALRVVYQALARSLARSSLVSIKGCSAPLGLQGDSESVSTGEVLRVEHTQGSLTL